MDIVLVRFNLTIFFLAFRSALFIARAVSPAFPKPKPTLPFLSPATVAIVAGDKKGSVGLGLGKAGDTALAINKALRNAKKNMVRLNLTKTMSIPHELSAKFSSSYIMLMPNKGRGLVAGSVVRDIVKLSGIKDI